MGLEFIQKAAPSFKRGLDRARISLGTPDLLTRHPRCFARAAAASVTTPRTLRESDYVTVQLVGGTAVAMQGLCIVATFIDPPAAIIDALAEAHGVAPGAVVAVHDLADIVEIEICPDL